MRLKEKINFKLYSALSLLLLILSAFFCTGPKEFLVVIVVFFAVILNQWMLLNVVDALVKNASDKESSGPANVLFSFLFKAIILVIAISFGVHIMGNRIIIPILIYIAQIFVLYFSLNRNKQ